MDTKRIKDHWGYALMAVLLCAFLAPAAALADDPVESDGSAAQSEAASPQAQLPTEKVETVNVTTDASGKVEKVEVENLLTNDGGAAELLDETELTDIEGIDDAEFETTEAGLVWTAGGENVTYKGTTDKNLPLQVKVKYFLDGEETSADDIAGKAGEVRIRYEFENGSVFPAYVNQMTVDMYTPFTCITAIMLDGDDFSNVSVENGKIINDGSDYIVTGYTMPGLKWSLGSLAKNADVPEWFEITAKTEHFQMKSTMTMVTAGLMSDMNVEGMGFDDMSDASSGLSNGIADLIDGSDQVTSGLKELANGSDELDKGAKGLSDGAGELSQGLYLLTYGEDGKSGLKGAASSSKDLAGAIGKTGDALNELADAKKGLPAVAGGLSQLADAYPSEKEVKGLLKAIEKDESLDPQTKAALGAIVSSTSTVKELSAATGKCAEGVTKLSESYGALSEQAGALPSGLGEAAKGAEKLYNGSVELASGAEELAKGTGTLADGAHSAADGSGTLTEGLRTYDREGISEVVYTIDNDLGGLKKRLNILSDAAKEYVTFSGKQPDTPGSVKFVYETAAIEAD